MKFSLFVFIAFSFVAQIAVKAQDTVVAASSSNKFHISSLNTPFAMQGDFEGEFRVLPDSIQINLNKTDIYLSDHCQYKGGRLLSHIRFGLVTKVENDKWRVTVKSEMLPLNKIMYPLDEYSVGTAYFSIPIDKTIDLPSSWLVIEMGDNPLELINGKKIEGFAFAKSRRDIFTSKEKIKIIF